MKKKEAKKSDSPNSSTFYLQNGCVHVRVHETAAELTKWLKECHQKTEWPEYVCGVYMPKIDYTSIGTLHIAKDASLGVVVHEMYHAVQHYLRVGRENPHGRQSKEYHLIEEREAAMFGFLFNQINDKLSEQEKK